MTRGEHMRAARKSAGLTQRELAALAGVERVTVARLECGMHQGGIDTIVLLADALGISIDEYIGHQCGRRVANA